MNEDWIYLSPRLRGNSLICGTDVHVLHKNRTQTWCGLDRQGMKPGFFNNGSGVNCPECMEAVAANYYRIFEKRNKADISPYIGMSVELEPVKEGPDQCPQCHSERIDRRWGEHSAFFVGSGFVKMECPVERRMTGHQMKHFNEQKGQLELACNECRAMTTLKVNDKNEFVIVEIRAY